MLLSSNLQQKREVVRNHSEDEEMESQEEEEESFGKFTPKEYRRDVPDRSSLDQGQGTQPPSLPLSLIQEVL